jgi:flavin-binding protein dodecin
LRGRARSTHGCCEAGAHALQLPHAGSMMATSQTALRSAGGRWQAMADSVYKIIELVGTSSESWEKAAAVAVAQAAKTLRDLRIAEVVQLDLQVQNGKIKAYRAKLKVSFKFEGKK